MENLATLFDCGNHFDPSTCRKDLFWRAIWNTAKFSVLQVTLMVLFSVITALVLNRKVIGRGFWRGVYFYPVLLSPVVVALIWKWILQREGVLNAVVVAVGGAPFEWLTERKLGVLLGDLRVDLGAHGLLHADPAGRVAGDSQGPVRSGADGSRVAVAYVLGASRCRC